MTKNVAAMETPVRSKLISTNDGNPPPGQRNPHPHRSIIEAGLT